ncbi:MAG: dTDP-4-amino-4,6-dideoxygalactose transaminase [Methylacidiphilales bacterium]|nr:dTDP-4-amino-4,6-dideoxygalactose transaminase [Candidatus Methylacidiphilales bacterium]
MPRPDPMKYQMHVPFNAPAFLGAEVDCIRRAIGKGHLAGNGFFTKECEKYLKELLGVKRAFLTTSCTHALEMCALLLNLQSGDEFIVPSFTFVSTVNAFALRGAKPIFVDVRPDTLNLDEEAVARQINSRTKAIIAVHYGGIGCEMTRLTELAQRHEIALIEDNAHGLFGRYRGKLLGTFGRFATLSFHETKNISCGEGGALLLNDERDIERAEILRDKGTNRGVFFRGQADKYTWVDFGSSYVMSEILAAYLWTQLNAYERIQKQRRSIWNLYQEQLQKWATEQKIQLPHVPSTCDQAYHLFYLILPTLENRRILIEHLRQYQINAVFHYQALNSSPMGQRLGGQPGTCPVTERLSDCLLRLPFYFDLTSPIQQRVIDRVLEFRVR